MAGKASTEQAWAEAARRCRLSPADARIPRELGFKPQGLLKSIPSTTQPWKASVAEWVRELYTGRQRRIERRRRRRERTGGPAVPAGSDAVALGSTLSEGDG